MTGDGLKQTHWLAPMLAPRSVALVGASPRAGSVGAAMVDVLAGGGFEGGIWPVNPRYEAIGERTCYPGLDALPGAPDLAVLSVASHRMEETLAGAIRAVTVSGPARARATNGSRIAQPTPARARRAALASDVVSAT